MLSNKANGSVPTLTTRSVIATDVIDGVTRRIAVTSSGKESGFMMVVVVVVVVVIVEPLYDALTKSTSKL